LQAKKILRQEEIVQQLNGRMVQEETDQEGSSGKTVRMMPLASYCYISISLVMNARYYSNHSH
jgi:hypothetical protein